MNYSACRTFDMLRVLLALAFLGSYHSRAATTFRIAPLTSDSLGIWEGQKPVLVYNHGSITNALAPKAESHSCYIHPVYGLDGEVLTGDFRADHVYHRGLYWAWSHIKIGEEEVDLWSLRGIRPRFERWLQREVTDHEAILAVENGWFVKDRQVMKEQMRLRVHPAKENSRAIDLELSWIPLQNPITLWGAPGKSYGGLTFRFGPRSKTIVTVPGGRRSEDLLMTKLAWADLTGDFSPNRLSGAAVFVHPDHPAFPPEWMTRDYGVLAVGFPGVNAKTFPAGEKFTCRYRIWVHRGNPDSDEIQDAYNAFRTGSGNAPK